MSHLEKRIACPETPGQRAKVRQREKIQRIRRALELSGHFVLDDQARALGLSRSTTWSIIRGTHKNSGLSTAVIRRMLSAPQLPAAVRDELVEYVEEKAAGLYGDKPYRLRQFVRRLGDDRKKGTVLFLGRPGKIRRSSLQGV
jgi:hypothetical protein